MLRPRVPSLRVIGCTPHYVQERKGVAVSHARGNEIQAWLDEHPEVTTFAIVDDSSDMEHLIDRLVQTTWAHGLLDEHVDRIVAMLHG